jgi:hypothetical protein
MTMRRGHHTSSVLKAMGAGADEAKEETKEEDAAGEPE